MIVLLDTGPLGFVINVNKNNLEVAQCQKWLEKLLRRRISVCVPEIAYYEIRREYVHLNKPEGCKRLDELVDSKGIGYTAITTEIMIKAADLWGWARKTGQQTAHNESIDSDVILAATAIVMASQGEHVVIATTNVGHLARYTPAKRWQDIDDSYIIEFSKY